MPVDSVIIAIFKKIGSCQNWCFNSINLEIKKYYHGHDIEIWDDLWFWGFITQRGSGENRAFEWNENKYWVLKETDKDQKTINEIHEKAELFLSLFNKELLLQNQNECRNHLMAEYSKRK